MSLIRQIEAVIRAAAPDAVIAPHSGQTIVSLPDGSRMWITERQLGRRPPPALADPPVSSVQDTQLALAPGDTSGRWLIRLRGEEAIGIVVRSNAGAAERMNAILAAIRRVLEQAS